MVKRLLLFLMLSSGAFTFANAQGSDKDFINQTGLELLDQWDAEAYRNVANLLTQIMDYDTKEITQWGVQSLKAMKSVITEPYNGISDGYKLMARASSFTGHFKALSNRWVKEGDADDLQFAFNDKNGTYCLFRLYTSGTKKVITFTIDEDEDDEWGDDDEWDDDDDEGLFSSPTIKEIMDGVKLISIEVPEHIDISFTQGKKQLMHTTIDFDMSLFTNNWEPLSDGFMVSVKSSFAKSSGTGTFDMGMENVGYKPGTGINFSFYVKNAGKSLVTFGINAPGTLNLDDGAINFDLDTGLTLNDIGIESLSLNLDVMGRIQAKGNIPDLVAFFNTLNSEGESEAEMKQIANKLNGLMNGNFYYNNGSTPKGYLAFQPYYDDDDEEWTVQPAIHFNSDNSTYPLETYFAEDNFPELYEGFGDIFSEMMELASTFIEKVQTMNEEASGATGIQSQPSVLTSGTRAEIYTSTGRLCGHTVIGANGQAVIPFTELPAGVYIVKTPSGSRKFIKK